MNGHSLTSTDRLCERTHAIAEEPRDTYLARYPKAVGEWSIKTKKGKCTKRLCESCARRFEAEGWRRSQSAELNGHREPRDSTKEDK